MTMLKIAIAGSSGRMTRALLEAVLHDPDLKLAAALEVKGNAAVGRDACELTGSPCGVRVRDDAAAAVADCDVLIGFTRPGGSAAMAGG